MHAPKQVVIAGSYHPHDHQLRVHTSGKRFVIIAAGVRGGKTYCACIEFVHRIIKDHIDGKGIKTSGRGRGRTPSLRYWIIAPTMMLTREAMRYVVSILEPSGLIVRQYDNQIWLKGEVLIEARSADNPKNLVAVGLNGILIDEAARVKSDAWLGQLRQRLVDKQGWALFPTTPLGRNWIWDLFVKPHGTKEQDADTDVIQWTTADNPYIPREEIAHAKATLPKAFFNREFLASFDAFIGNIFEEFEPAKHIITESEFRIAYGIREGSIKSIFRRIIAGVDFGWTSPGAIVVIGDLGLGRCVVLEESYAAMRTFYNPNAPDVTWIGEATRLQRKWGIDAFYCDPSEPGYRADMIGRGGLNALAADNEIIYGLRKIKEALTDSYDGKPRLQIFSDCTNLIREMRNYVWKDKTAAGDFRDEPAANQSDHSIDAARYGMIALVGNHNVINKDQEANEFYRRMKSNPIG